jgi:hypothetical protein
MIYRISNALSLHRAVEAYEKRPSLERGQFRIQVPCISISRYWVEIIRLPPILTSYLVHGTIPGVPTVASGGRRGTRRSFSHVHYISWHPSTLYRPQRYTLYPEFGLTLI